jgi:double-stranded uracil-DNA glycosylase
MTSYRTTETWLGQRCDTLEDILAPGLVCVFVGLNPSVVSVEKGHYLQGTLGRQFWRLLHTYGILPEPENGAFVDDTLLANGFGITDLAKCPSPRADVLTREDIEAGRAMLLHKIESYQPKIVCSVYRKTLEVLTGRKYTHRFGLLDERIGETLLFVAPFPYRPAEQVREYLPQLRGLIEEARAEMASPDDAIRRFVTQPGDGVLSKTPAEAAKVRAANEARFQKLLKQAKS